eukprot:9407495-Pyramimonas_sp.AAC.1
MPNVWPLGSSLFRNHLGMPSEIIRNGGPPAWQIAVIKTIVGGWLTSARLHSSEVGMRRFQYALSRDDRLHYIHCLVMWRLVYHPESPPACPAT